MTTASDDGIFLSKLITSKEIKRLCVTHTDLICSINMKLSFVEYLDGKWGERSESKNWAEL